MPRFLRTSVVLVLSCAVPRLIYLWVVGPPQDTDYYWELASGLMRQHALIFDGRPTTAFEPLYPAFLALARWMTADHAGLVILVQIAVACAGVLWLYALVISMTRDHVAALVAALLLAGYPYLIRQSTAWIELTLLITLLLASWYYFTRIGGRAPQIACGVAMALAILTRAMVAPIWIVALALLIRDGKWRAAATVAATTLILVAPALVRNYRIDGSLVPTRTGANLYVGNCEYSDRLIPRYDTDLLNYSGAVKDLNLTTPAAVDHALTLEAWSFMRAHPLRTLRLKLLNFVYFFDVRIVPYEALGPDSHLTILDNGGLVIERLRTRPLWMSAVHSVVYSVILIGAVAGLTLRRRLWRKDFLLLASVAVFALVSMVYFPTTRLREPIIPVLMAYAGCAASAALTRWKGRRVKA